MAKLTVNLKFDATGIETSIASVLALIESPDRPVKARRALGKSVNKLFDRGLAIDFDEPAALRAGELVIRTKPSKRLVDLLTAFRAGD